MAALVLDAIAASLLDVLVGLVVVAPLLAFLLSVIARNERAATEIAPEPEPEVVEAFSQFPERWRPEGEATACSEDWGRAA